MQKFYLYIFFFLFVFISPQIANAQFNRERTVRLSATVTENPASITLHFQQFSDATRLRVFRKLKDDTDWGNPYATIANSATSYTDNSVQVGQAYEYMVMKEGGTTALGYIYSGIGYKGEDQHGKLLLLVDATYATTLATEIKQLERDLIGDGWQVVRMDINRTETPVAVRNKIKAQAGIKAVLLFGHIPVPYSGNLNPDGHPDHKGAWPCDGYYGDLDGEWYDIAVSNSAATRAENRNEPGDGKFDGSNFASEIELQVGRVDMFNLPIFTGTDADLLRYYLEKNHNYRMGTLTAPFRALIDDNFQSYTIASSNWRNFCPAVDSSTIVQNLQGGIDYYTTLKQDWYLVSGGAGGGYYNSCGGVINSSQFATDSIKTIFTGLAGSYFGDWDSQDNLLRSALASKPGILASYWSGIPNWALHHMALGENIGYGARLTQNEKGGLYEGNFNISQNLVQIALMGDPTLRLHVVQPPKNLTADSTATKRITLNWTASTDNNIVGYHVYRAAHLYGDFERITTTPVTGTTMTDITPLQGKTVYMVRALKKETTPSGTYYNYSQAAIDSATNTFPTGIADVAMQPLHFSLYPNPASSFITIDIATADNLPAIATFTNVVGQTVKTINIENKKAGIDVSELAPGIYFVNIDAGKYTGTQKLIIK